MVITSIEMLLKNKRGVPSPRDEEKTAVPKITKHKKYHRPTIIHYNNRETYFIGH